MLASVGPMLVPKASPLAWSRGTENTVLVGGRYGGDVVFSGHGAGGHPTAVAVVSDLISIAHGSRAIDLPSQKTTVGGEFLLRHSIRFVVNDSPGIIAEIALALAEQGEGQLFGGPEQPHWIALLEANHDNFRAAFDWFAERGEDERCLRLGAALWVFWEACGHWSEGRERLRRTRIDARRARPTPVRRRRIRDQLQ